MEERKKERKRQKKGRENLNKRERYIYYTMSSKLKKNKAKEEIWNDHKSFFLFTNIFAT